jgi:hypothetical protein
VSRLACESPGGCRPGASCRLHGCLRQLPLLFEWGGHSSASTVKVNGQLLAISVQSFDNTPPPTASPNLNLGSQEVAPGQGVNAYYQIVMYGPDAYTTQVQVSVDASVGSGSVILPIQDSVSPTSSPPSTAPPTTLPGTAVATKVSAGCTAQALSQAIAQASTIAASGTVVVDSQFACIQGYAKAAVQAPGADPGVAYYEDVSGYWTVLSAGGN